MNIDHWLSEFKRTTDSCEKQVIPRKKSKVKEIRIIELRQLIVLGFPLSAGTSAAQLTKYRFFGQFRNIKEISFLNSQPELGLTDLLVTLTCEVSACLCFFVSLKVGPLFLLTISERESFLCRARHLRAQRLQLRQSLPQHELPFARPFL